MQVQMNDPVREKEICCTISKLRLETYTHTSTTTGHASTNERTGKREFETAALYKSTEFGE